MGRTERTFGMFVTVSSRRILPILLQEQAGILVLERRLVV